MSGVLFYNKCRIKTNVLTSIQLTEAEEKDVNFYDYDGFRLLSYTNAEALALTELPENHAANENLTFDEWNWTLADIKTQINNVGGVVNVGAIYHTTDDKTHIICKPTVTYPQTSIRLTPSNADAVTVDWGDGSTDTWTSASSATKSHTYTDVTDSSVYDITISCSLGTYVFSYISGNNSNANFTCIDIKLSNKVTSLGDNCFNNCRDLQSINIPNTVISMGTNCFTNCLFQCVNIPDSITSLYGCFQNNQKLTYITFPSTLTNLGDNSVKGSNSLKSVTIPNGVTSLGTLIFSSSYIDTITLPNSVTSLSSGCFNGCCGLKSVNIPDDITQLLDSTFFDCNSLKTITIPSGVTSMGTAVFDWCYSLHTVYMKPVIPPTIGTSVFENTNNLVIYVPTGSLSDYQNAENWSTYSANMLEYNYN